MKPNVYVGSTGKVRIEVVTVDSNKYGDTKYTVELQPIEGVDPLLLQAHLQTAFNKLNESVHLVGYAR